MENFRFLEKRIALLKEQFRTVLGFGNDTLWEMYLSLGIKKSVLERKSLLKKNCNVKVNSILQNTAYSIFSIFHLYYIICVIYFFVIVYLSR